MELWCSNTAPIPIYSVGPRQPTLDDRAVLQLCSSSFTHDTHLFLHPTHPKHSPLALLTLQLSIHQFHPRTLPLLRQPPPPACCNRIEPASYSDSHRGQPPIAGSPPPEPKLQPIMNPLMPALRRTTCRSCSFSSKPSQSRRWSSARPGRPRTAIFFPGTSPTRTHNPPIRLSETTAL